MFKHKWLWLIGLLLMAVLAACGGNVPATAAPVNQHFETSATGGNITLNYPTGWLANVSNGQIVVASSQAAIDAPSPASGQFVMRMVVGPISALGGLSAESTAREVIQFFATSLSSTGVTFGQPTDLTIGSFSASRIVGSSSDGQGNITAVNMGDGIYNIASAASATGEMNNFEATLNAILASMTYAAIPAADTPQNEPAAITEASG